MHIEQMGRGFKKLAQVYKLKCQMMDLNPGVSLFKSPCPFPRVGLSTAFGSLPTSWSVAGAPPHSPCLTLHWAERKLLNQLSSWVRVQLTLHHPPASSGDASSFSDKGHQCSIFRETGPIKVVILERRVTFTCYFYPNMNKNFRKGSAMKMERIWGY